MKKTPCALCAVSLLAVATISSQADTFYWGTATPVSPWQGAGNWFLDASGTSSTISVPGAADDAVFSITSLNGTTITPVLSATTSVNSLTFDNTVALTITGTSGNRNLEVGAGGITLSASAANVTLGSSTGGKNVFVKIREDQTWTNNSAGTFNVRNSSQASDLATGPVVLTLNAASTGGITNSGAFSDGAGGSLALVVDSTGSGIVTMGGGSYSGGTTVRSGALQAAGNFGSQGVVLGHTSGSANTRLILTSSATNTITVRAGNTGTAALAGNTGSNYQGSILLERDVTLGSTSNSGQTVIFSGVISGTGNVIAARLGTSTPTVVLSGSNTYVGKTTIDSAVLVANSLNRVVGGSASSSLGAAPLDAAAGTIRMSAVAASTLRYTGTGETTDRTIEIAGNLGATLDQSGTVGNLNFTSALAQSGVGSRTLTLTGTTAGTGEFSGAINNIGTGTNVGVTKTGSGTWRISGTANTYANTTSITGGVLEVTKMADTGLASSIGTGSVASLTFGGGTLRYVGSGDSSNRAFTVGAAGATLDASGSGALVFSRTTAPAYGTAGVPVSITLTGTNAGANTYAANQNNNGVGAVSITKNGIGTWVMTGSNSYTGATTVNAGTLLINGSLAAGSAVALNSATLGGSGTAGGLVTTSGTASIVSPGNSPGTLTLAGGLDAAAGATFVFELGTSADVLSLGSGVLTGSTAAGGMVFNFSDSGGLVGGSPYTIMTFGSSTGLSYTDLATNTLPAGYVLDTSFGTGGYQINGTNLQVQFVVPEPSTVLLLAGGLMAMTLLRRRHH